ncbi:hypothetical protein DTO166G4_7974 [Paecilomyces variotii]|nr:hypothetical protein DTO166G4_7974 [Paecilomyces variotii]KAJ9229763.1 hypothetical protein DTO166G5_7685 [Paecilomyces variotii]KAJ9244801.1 hypothetical protein DTO169E5_1182 [Paecilomyces variotii]KAJ9247762.1 hypothetical protein DTO207G8_7870 [Paecilomyces variotii]KAJ9301742.1 hypothetical protein DTO217A2_7501 [Paecilomyces variotii]
MLAARSISPCGRSRTVDRDWALRDSTKKKKQQRHRRSRGKIHTSHQVTCGFTGVEKLVSLTSNLLVAADRSNPEESSLSLGDAHVAAQLRGRSRGAP